ncbi:hypothetical protein N7G274_002777 [Stereocaulon virgatum]|uniref:Elongin-A n=1 Tax=Stereocaulon virgatum TaxID=373712 RepID=A0ABR4AK10_9LECA
MPARSLHKMATQACIRNIRSILDVGEAPYELVRPLLLELQDPQQLRQLELVSPQIWGPDGEVWLQFIKRDVPNWDKKPHEPRDPKNWHKVYRKLCKDSRREVEDDAAALKAEMDRIKNEQAKNTIHRVELNIVKVPEGMIRHGRTIKLSRKPDLHEKRVEIPPDRSVRRVTHDSDEGGPRRPTRITANLRTKGELKLKQFRKEAKVMGHFSHQQQHKGQLGVWKGQDMKAKPVLANKPIVTAPRCLIDEHRKHSSPRPIDTSIKPPTVFAPRRRRIEHNENAPPTTSTNEERENRLRAFTNPSSARESASTSNHPKTTLTPVRSDSQAHDDTPIPSVENRVVVPKPQIANPIPRLPGASAQDSPASGHRVPRLNTSSPSNGSVRPARPLKAKAPVDIFMPRAKRQRLA